jgi:hypothetical protein
MGVKSAAISANPGDGEVVKVWFKSELPDQNTPELIKIMWAQVVRPVADLAYHVVMSAIRVGQLIVEAVSYCYFRHHPETLEKMEGAVDGSNVHIRIGLFGPAEYFVHSHMPSTLGYYGENQ